MSEQSRLASKTSLNTLSDSMVFVDQTVSTKKNPDNGLRKTCSNMMISMDFHNNQENEVFGQEKIPVYSIEQNMADCLAVILGMELQISFLIIRSQNIFNPCYNSVSKTILNQYYSN